MRKRRPQRQELGDGGLDEGEEGIEKEVGVAEAGGERGGGVEGEGGEGRESGVWSNKEGGGGEGEEEGGGEVGPVPGEELQLGRV